MRQESEESGQRICRYFDIRLNDLKVFSFNSRNSVLLIYSSFSGVETVTTEFATNKLTVVGNVDPWKIRDLVESRAHRKVDLVSPNVPRKEEKPKEEKPKEEKKTEEKKPKEVIINLIISLFPLIFKN